MCFHVLEISDKIEVHKELVEPKVQLGGRPQLGRGGDIAMHTHRRRCVGARTGWEKKAIDDRNEAESNDLKAACWVPHDDDESESFNNTSEGCLSPLLVLLLCAWPTNCGGAQQRNQSFPAQLAT